MRSKRFVLALAVVAMLTIAVGAFSTAVEAARPPADPNCTGPCKPFVVFPGFGKCYFVGCDVEGICRYIC